VKICESVLSAVRGEDGGLGEGGRGMTRGDISSERILEVSAKGEGGKGTNSASTGVGGRSHVGGGFARARLERDELLRSDGDCNDGEGSGVATS